MIRLEENEDISVVFDNVDRKTTDDNNNKVAYVEIEENDISVVFEKVDRKEYVKTRTQEINDDDISVVFENVDRKGDLKTKTNEFYYPEIEVKYKSQITGFDMNVKEKVEMAQVGLPLSFGNPARREEKLIFWCRVCQIELNSEDAMIKHIKGTKHYKKMLREMGSSKQK